MKKSHVFDPKNIDILEMEDRKIWQNPEEILEMVKIQPNFIAADLGCGSGFFTVPLAQKVEKVYGIDIQKEMLDFLEQKIHELKIKNIETLLSRENEIPLVDGILDLIVSINTLHEFEDKGRMVEEMGRVLRRFGILLIIDFKKEKTSFGPPFTIRISKEQAISLFEKKGFITLKLKDFIHHYLLVFQKRIEYLKNKY